MTIDELVKARKVLEKNIRSQLDGFIEATGVEIRGVDVDIFEIGGIGGGGRTWDIGRISVRCDL